MRFFLTTLALIRAYCFAGLAMGMSLLYLSGELGLNRHTTLHVSKTALLIEFTVALVLIAWPFLVSLANEDGWVNWYVTRNSSVLDRGVRAIRLLWITILVAAALAGSCWYISEICAQHVKGAIGFDSGTVVRVNDSLGGRQSCRISLAIEKIGGSVLHVCYVAGFLWSNEKISPTLPEVGQHVNIITKSNWFGTAVERLVF